MFSILSCRESSRVIGLICAAHGKPSRGYDAGHTPARRCAEPACSCAECDLSDLRSSSVPGQSSGSSRSGEIMRRLSILRVLAFALIAVLSAAGVAGAQTAVPSARVALVVGNSNYGGDLGVLA